MNDSSRQLNLTVNGQPRLVPAGTLAALLSHLGIESTAVVAEVNGRIIAPENFADTSLGEGDQVELAGFVGGG